MSLKQNLPRYNSLSTLEKFFQVMMDHFPYIRKNGLFEVVTISAVDAEIYRGDFHGLLEKHGIQHPLHRIFTAFNGLNSPLDYDGSKTNIEIINRDVISNCQSIFSVEM